MIAKGLVFLVLTIILGLITLSSFIGIIIKWKDRKVRNICIATTILCFILTILSGLYLTIKTVTIGGKTLIDEVSAMNVPFEKNEYERYSLLDTIKSYQPDSINVPISYYTYYGVRDYYRMPLVYPYSLNCIDVLEKAYITYEGERNPNNSKQILHDIDSIVFDRNILAARLAEGMTDDSTKYILLHFRSGMIENLNNKNELKQRMNELKFDSSKKMVSIEQYYYSL